MAAAVMREAPGQHEPAEDDRAEVWEGSESLVTLLVLYINQPWNCPAYGLVMR